MSGLRIDDFLSGKVYGSPLAPRNFSELVFYIQIFSKELVHEASKWLEHNYKSKGFINTAFYLIGVSVSLLYCCKIFRQVLFYVRGYGLFKSVEIITTTIKKRIFQLILRLPPVKKKVDIELAATKKHIESELIQTGPNLSKLTTLPEAGLNRDEIINELDQLNNLKHTDWENGRVSGAVYHGGSELLDLQSVAYHKFSVANQLHPDIFPGVRKMESEIVSMILKMFNAPEDECGLTTSGGTESLLLAGLAAREYGRRYRGIKNPEIVAPVTVHAGIDKACYYFGMKLRKVDLDESYGVDISKVKKLINRNTVLLVGSAPNFPHGIIDDISSLSELAVKYDIPLHVDACLGSFVVPFIEESKVHGNRKIPLFDFRLPGVTSISCDTHKYGFAPKGSSVIMYRSPKLRECQYYVLSNWTGGLYGSPTLAGSRPGALMVGCWATLAYFGRNEYVKFCYEIVSTAMQLKNAIKEHTLLKEHLEVIGDPVGAVVAFKARENTKPSLDIYRLGDILTKKGWHFASLQQPSALHFAFTRLTINKIDELIKDLIAATKETLEQSDSSESSEIGALYGVAGSVKTTGVAERVITAFIDTLYKV